MAPTESRVTPLEHTAIGAAAGMFEVCVMQPMVAFKNALQEGRPLPRTPLALYRGLVVGGVGWGRVECRLGGRTGLGRNELEVGKVGQ